MTQWTDSWWNYVFFFIFIFFTSERSFAKFSLDFVTFFSKWNFADLTDEQVLQLRVIGLPLQLFFLLHPSVHIGLRLDPIVPSFCGQTSFLTSLSSKSFSIEVNQVKKKSLL